MKRFQEQGQSTKRGEDGGDKGGKREKAKKIKRVKFSRGQEKRGLLCMCINRVYDEVSFLCCVQ